MPKINVELMPFYLMDAEVSMELWSACVKKGVCQQVPRDKNWVGESLPVVNVSWNDIVENFIPWLNSISSISFRLPTEYEWEYAASEGSDRKYIWGNNFGRNKASCANCGSKFDGRQPAPVRYFPKNSWGLYGMLGNVEEWTADCWTTNHVTADQYKLSVTNKNCQFRTIKGASWVHQDWALIPYVRTYSAEHRRFEFVGFRLAADYE
jgi:formylglycine-generating enzyme required for sulfatase activity